jgi:RHS repeat-associated protein
MPGREHTPGYRYGFNGKEDDKETVGAGSGTQDYGLRIYNPSLGKFLSVDPLTADYPWYTPYQFAGNKPIQFIDLDGAEEMDVNGKYGPWSEQHLQDAIADYLAQANEANGNPVFPGDAKKIAGYYDGPITSEIMEKTERRMISAPAPVFFELNGRKGVMTLLGGSLKDVGIGGTSTAGSFTPVYGGIRNGINGIQNGRYIGGTLNILGGVSDVFMVKALATKGGMFLLTKFGGTGGSSGAAYSVAFETKLSESFTKASRGTHFREANKALLSTMDNDAVFAQQMERIIPGLRQEIAGAAGGALPRSPFGVGWTWHHSVERGVMQLVPSAQHTSPWMQPLFHPGGVGGFSIWGK